MPVPAWLSRATRSALIVPVPETEPLVTSHRRRLVDSPTSTVPAHVTVLYPFVHPASIGVETLGALGAALAAIPAFDCAFSQVKWFDEEVVWLEPKPDEHFRALTAAVCERFPAHLPYDGEHPDTVPHLTVADSRSGDTAGKQRIATDIAAHLPVHARIDRVRLVAGEDEYGPWRTIAEFALPPAVP
ncbi:2'-5' RNA ligase family protein [Amycolatopsis alkalitolerans]|uniref:2'-5' RNA ligase family protein n=1 Tax=Amycolatopsis alkalitolerans TaxID=2547244 RepID=A0A5C4LZ02_9PSEU|nr:2'-5' RNA ligase family protein [Amycolatopsis alkalitolerans]TNC23949.1 2'-5' RNA ligase family protein [Amycolatopsis alkalitolerans]